MPSRRVEVDFLGVALLLLMLVAAVHGNADGVLFFGLFGIACGPLVRWRSGPKEDE